MEQWGTLSSSVCTHGANSSLQIRQHSELGPTIQLCKLLQGNCISISKVVRPSEPDLHLSHRLGWPPMRPMLQCQPADRGSCCSSASLGAHRHRGTASPRHNGPGSFNRPQNYSTQCSNSPRISRAAAYLCVYAEFLLWNQFELETQYKLHVDILPNLGDAK